MTIFLIRHGQKYTHLGDPGLTPEGILQAQQTGIFLKQFPITKVFTSPFKRTVETAQHICEALGLDFEKHDALVERMSWEDPEITREQFLKEWTKATADREYQPVGGDSSFATGTRMKGFIDSKKNENAHFVIVTHGGAILDYLRTEFGDSTIQSLRKEYAQGFDYEMRNCAINQIFLAETPKIELLNHVEHLEVVSE